MSDILSNLPSISVFKYFNEISQIPRGSGNEQAISDYLVNFAKGLGLEVIQDDFLNIIIKKPATKGYENAPGVILQGHMDMVCEKNKGTDHDFTKDPIKLRIDGDMIYATDTTLGADNGIAVAMGMAVLASNDIAHPAVELLVTVDEEAGMTGAMNLDGSMLSGKYILNLDSEEEGYLLVSCAGGVTALSTLPVEKKDAKEDALAYSIEIKGLLGGHSGMDIIKQRGNSNVLMGRLLNLLGTLKNVNFDLVEISGGSKNNAIPRESEATILIDKADKDALVSAIDEISAIYKNEFKTSDKGLEIVLHEVGNSFDKVLADTCKKNVINILNLVPNGIQTMSMDIEGLVESSTNLGVVTTTENHISFECAVRSSVMSLKNDITDKMQSLCDAFGAKLDLISNYPEWEYVKDSKLEEICVNTYKELTGKDVIIMALHAGLECGLLLDKISNTQAISLGPNMYDVHTPNEHLSISSTVNTWEYLLAILKNIQN